MIIRAALIIVLPFALASCSDDLTQGYVDQLVDRFEAPACDDARLIRAGRNPDETKQGGQIVYAVDDDCIVDMRRAFEVIAFEKTENDTYLYTSDSGWWELVRLTRADDQQKAGIIWETFEQ